MMRFLKVTATCLAVTVVSTTLLVAPCIAQAQEAKPTAIAFVDTPRIMRESTAARSVRAQLDKQQGRYKSELDAQNGKLQTQEKALEKQQSSLSPSEFEHKRRAFQTQVDALNHEADRRRQQMAFAQDDAMKKLQPVLTKVVANVAKSVGATIVLDTSRVIVSSNNLDITGQVLKELDKKLPSITVSFNAPEAKSPAPKHRPKPAQHPTPTKPQAPNLPPPPPTGN